MSSATRRRRGKAKGGEEGAKKERVVEEVEEELRKVEKAAAKGARRVEKAVEGKSMRKAPPKPAGRTPVAMVTARHGTGVVTRVGRGFSLGELSGGGLTPALAARWGLRTDSRRRSVLDGNVGALRTWHATGARATVEREMKGMEEELEKVGGELEKEAAAVEREVVKVAKEVKKEGKKAEKTVKGKVEKPRARPKKKT